MRHESISVRCLPRGSNGPTTIILHLFAGIAFLRLLLSHHAEGERETEGAAEVMKDEPFFNQLPEICQGLGG